VAGVKEYFLHHNDLILIVFWWNNGNDFEVKVLDEGRYFR
jgi:hypothetical protein